MPRRSSALVVQQFRFPTRCRQHERHQCLCLVRWGSWFLRWPSHCVPGLCSHRDALLCESRLLLAQLHPRQHCSHPTLAGRHRAGQLSRLLEANIVHETTVPRAWCPVDVSSNEHRSLQRLTARTCLTPPLVALGCLPSLQGRYDMVCPMASAWDLHKAWPSSQLKVGVARHRSLLLSNNVHNKKTTMYGRNHNLLW